MEKTILYMDVLLLINGAMDGVLLWLVARIAERKVAPGRLAAGILLGSLTTWFLLLPPGWEWTQGLGGRLAVALAMIGWTYGPQGVKEWLRISALFFFANFALGSLVLGLQNFLLGYGESRLIWVGVSFLLVLALGVWGNRWWKRGGKELLLHVPVQIEVGGKTVRFQGLFDSGNRLMDPLTRKPVLVAEYDSVKGLLPEGWQCRADEVLEGLPDGWKGRLRLIPFASVGNPGGLLMGFRPDRVRIGAEEQTLIIAVAHHPLSSNGSYQALIPWQGRT